MKKTGTDSGDSRALPAPRLVIRAGALRGRKCPIPFSPFMIGADQESSLIISDPLVSRQHAEIVQGEGGAWFIRDLGSRNGTKVNDALLAEDARVMLKKGDRIFIAQCHMIFDDGTGLPGDRTTWIAVAVAAAVVLTAVLAFRVKFPPAGTWMARAKGHLQAAEFKEAEECLDRTMTARRSAPYRAEAIALRTRLAEWTATLAAWRSGRAALESGRWDEAAARFSELRTEDEDAWAWNREGTEMRDEACRAVGLLRAFLSAKEESGRNDSHAKLKALLAGMRTGAPAYLKNLLADCDRLIGELEEFTFLDRLTSWPPAISEVRGVLVQTRDNASGTLGRRAGSILKTVDLLAAAMARYRQAEGLLKELRLAELRAVAPDLPGPDDCEADQRLAVAAGLIEEHFDVLRKAADLAETAVAARNAANSAALQWDEWRKVGALDGVLNCDVIALDVPAPDRTQPAGEYDRFVGVEEFRGLCMDLAGLRQLRVQKTPFRTVAASSEELRSSASALLAFCASHSGEDWRAGAMETVVEDCRKLVAQQRGVAGELLKTAGESGGRAALIAAGLALRLAGADTGLTVNGTELNTWIAVEFKKNLEQVQLLDKAYADASEARRVEIQKQVLGLGLPGDPVMTRMWSPAVGAGLLPKSAMPAGGPAKVPEQVAVVTPPVKAPADRTRDADYVRTQSALLKEIRSATTVDGLSAAMRSFATWESDSNNGPVKADAELIAGEITARYSMLANERYGIGRMQYEAMKMQEGDSSFRLLLAAVRATPKRYGRDDLLELVSELKAVRQKAQKKLDAARTPPEPKPPEKSPEPEPAETRPPEPGPTEPSPAEPKPQEPEPTHAGKQPESAGEMGVLEVVTSPDEALVYVDGTLMKQKSMELDPDVNHTVRVECDGYRTHEQSYRVRPGTKRTVEILLQKEKKKSGFFGR